MQKISTALLWVCAASMMGMLWSCGTNQGKKATDRPMVMVSIAPLEYLVRAVADTTVEVQVMVPETTSPETFEPTVAQLRALSQAKVYAAVGLIDFEAALCDQIRELAPQATYADLSVDVPVMEGSCSHAHQGHNHRHTAEHQNNGRSNGHGIDPHIWLSPRLLKTMAENLTRSLVKTLPDHKVLYEANLSKLSAKLDSLDEAIAEAFKNKRTQTFVIAHPSLSYYAQDYGLQQVAIENEGKEPTTGQLSALVQRMKADTLGLILYQRQVSGGSAEVLATHTGAKAVEFDPLAMNVIQNLSHITGIICSTLR